MYFQRWIENQHLARFHHISIILYQLRPSERGRVEPMKAMQASKAQQAAKCEFIFANICVPRPLPFRSPFKIAQFFAALTSNCFACIGRSMNNLSSQLTLPLLICTCFFEKSILNSSPIDLYLFFEKSSLNSSPVDLYLFL